jgi:hypothetical protein
VTGVQETLLPPAFAELEPFVAHWAGETTEARRAARCSLEMDGIRAFYDAMVPRAEEALAWLERVPMSDLQAEDRRLLALVLALAQAHVAVELHRAPLAPGTPWPNSIRIKSGLPVLG